MNRKNRKRYGKALTITVFLAAAGFSHSCGAAGKGEIILTAEEDRQRKVGAGMQAGQEELDVSEALTEQNALNASVALAGDEALRRSEHLKDQSILGESEAFTEQGMPSGQEKPESSCFVHVCGQVENPGVYELKEGQRVFEAIKMAGGFTDKAAEDYLNLAEPVWDGMRLEVPDQEQVPDTEWTARTGVQAGSHGESGQPGNRTDTGMLPGNRGLPSSEKVNLNTATKEELMTLRGIGEARAEDIIRYREERGGFGRIEDIMEISGIKDAAFQKIKDDIIV